MMRYILSIDQGTSSTRTIIFDEMGSMISSSQKEHEQFYPHPSWVEHDPLEIKNSVLFTMKDAVDKSSIQWKDIVSIGITNQRETIIAWDKQTGDPLYNAIVWQCRRTVPLVNELKERGLEEKIHQKTGLVLDAYFSGTKAKWLIENVEKVSEANKNGSLAFGTIDAWIIYFLTGEHATDASNASRTLLYNINTMNWDPELCELLGVPLESLPQVKMNAADPFGYLEQDGIRIPIRGVLGDQQAALFGQAAFSAGEIKCTYGTGNFILLNTGEEEKLSQNGLLTTVAWQFDNKTVYALEGSVFVTGAALRWLRDGLNIIPSFDQIDNIAASQNDANGVIFVPAFVGLGAPYWDSTATGMIIGITGGTNQANILHATLDAIAYQTEELVSLMKTETGLDISDLHVDGGTTRSDVLMQKQADVSQIVINRPKNIETTALGAAYMAGYGLIWNNLDEIRKLYPVDQKYQPVLNKEKSVESIRIWKKAVERSINWK